MKKFIDKYLHAIILLLLFVLLITLSLLSEGYNGGSDSLAHYFMSRYSFIHPYKFLDLWGRPLFTILSSPFSQFGFHAIMIFNVLTGLLTSYISYLLAKKLNLKPSFLVILLVCFTPLYCNNLMSGLTEILFSLILVLAVYYFFEEKYILSSVIISFLLFARNEGFIFIPLFLLAFLAKRKVKAIPFLATGFLSFSLIGSFFYKDLLWIIHNYPYSVHNPSYYKSGSLFQFFIMHDQIMGTPLELLAGIGVVFLISRFFSKDRQQRIGAFYEFLLIPGPVVLYAVFHAVLYWKGLGGSLGLVRVLAGVLPLAAILGMKGYHQINKFLPDPWMKSIILIVCIIMVTRTNFLTYAYPVELGYEENLQKQASLWYEKSIYVKEPLYYTDFNSWFFLDTRPDIDPVIQPGLIQINSVKDLRSIPPGCIVQWDAHYGANECRVPRDSVMLDPHLKLLNYIQDDRHWSTLGGKPYDILFFIEMPHDKKVDNYSLMDSLHSEKEKLFQHKFLLSYDFEKISKGIDSLKVTRAFAHSGTHSFRIDKETGFGPVIAINGSDISYPRKKILIEATAFVFLPDSLRSDAVYLVVSLEEKNDSYQYENLPLNDLNLKINQ